MRTRRNQRKIRKRCVGVLLCFSSIFAVVSKYYARRELDLTDPLLNAHGRAMQVDGLLCIYLFSLPFFVLGAWKTALSG